VAAVDALKDVPLLSCLSQRELKRVARNVREQSFAPGTTVIREGKMSGVGFFIVVEGEAEVSAGGAGLGRLHPGDHFGELALIGKRERTATTAEQDSREQNSHRFHKLSSRNRPRWNIVKR